MNPAYPLTRERNLILGALLIMAVLAWAVLVWQTSQPDEADMMGLTMGMGAVLFVAIWIVMMVAMMFPTAAPMILTFARIQENKQHQGQAFVPTWLFTLAYLLLWTAAGVVAFVVATIAEDIADGSMWLMDNAARIGGVLLIVAGLYQLSPLKNRCLTTCRTPTTFIMSRWREGNSGAVRMGLEHAAYCLGCCWLLFAILFPLGIMNIAAMAAITLLIFAEKSLAIGPLVSRVAAVFFASYGIVVLFWPDALATSL